MSTYKRTIQTAIKEIDKARAAAGAVSGRAPDDRVLRAAARDIGKVIGTINTAVRAADKLVDEAERFRACGPLVLKGLARVRVIEARTRERLIQATA